MTVFRDGRVAASAPREQWSKREMVRAMIGRELQTQPAPRPQGRNKGKAPVLEAKRVSDPGDPQ